MIAEQLQKLLLEEVEKALVKVGFEFRDNKQFMNILANPGKYGLRYTLIENSGFIYYKDFLVFHYEITTRFDPKDNVFWMDLAWMEAI